MAYRYSRWDGSQRIEPFAAEDVIDDLAEDLMEHGDLRSALRRLLRRGMNRPDGSRQPNLQDVLEELRRRRREHLDRYDLSSMMEDIQRQLEDIVQTERRGIQRRLDQARRPDAQGNQPDPALRNALEKMASQRQQALDQLPPDPAGQIKQLSNYDFMDQEARQKFDDLMKMLQQQMLGNQFEGLKQSIQSLTPEDMKALREMVRDLNRMLQEKMDGGNPDFEGFMAKHGRFFPPGIENLDQLIEHLQRRASQMQSLLNSMTPEMRESLRQMMDDLLKDDRLRWDMMLLASNLERLLPMDELQNRYPFRGDEPLTMEEAMRLMDRLQRMDELEREIRNASDAEDIEKLDLDRVRELAGPDAAEHLERLRQLMKQLEEEGYVEKRGDRYELTAKAIRRIGQKALRDIFGMLKKDAFGKHEVEYRGTGGERGEDTKSYEFGDPFMVNLEETLMNSMVREGAGTPVRVLPKDFVVYRTEHLTEASIVLMVDMSRSMLYNGCFSAAKKVALALNSLIRGQYPNDNLYIVVFSRYAREVRPEALAELSWDEELYGTNLHHALMLGRKLLGRHKGANRQIIVVTDGEPTAHLEGEVAHFAYPPVPRTIIETLKEVDRCTKDRITINTFMLEQDRSLMQFVGQMTKINKGRAFYCTPERLGEYILVDYVASKRKRVA